MHLMVEKGIRGGKANNNTSKIMIKLKHRHIFNNEK